MAENKVKGARFAPDVEKKIEAYREIFGWDFGQVVTQLLNYRDRINSVVSRIEVVQTSQGDSLMFLRGGPESNELGEEAVAYWLVQELQKSIAEGFREPFLGIVEPWEE